MKKIIAILMVAFTLAAMLPLGMTANAAEATRKPFYGIGGQASNASYDNINGSVMFELKRDGDTLTLTYANSFSTPSAMARKVKTVMDARPAGQRYIYIHGIGRAFDIKEDAVFPQKGISQLCTLITEFMDAYKSRGGQLDGVVLDSEYVWMSSWYIYSEIYYAKDAQGNGLGVTNPNIYQEIVENPLYATVIRPLLVERGFVFNTVDPTAAAWTHYSGQSYNGKPGVKSELWGIWSSQNRMSKEEEARYAGCTAIWDTVIRNYMNDLLNESVYDPVRKHYPDAIVTDYESKDSYSWLKNLNDSGALNIGGNLTTVGNTSNEETYSRVPNGSFYDTGYLNLAGYNKAYFEDDRFNMFLFEVNRYKNIYAASSYNRITPWISGYAWNSEREMTMQTLEYYTEQLYHIGMLAPEPFLLYMIPKEYASQAEHDSCIKTISEILAELTRVAGWSDRKPIEIPVNWNDGYVISGMYAGGRNIWRITPDTSDGMTLEKFKVKDKAPTFSINGKTIVFPQGRIIEDSSINVTGTCGYWIETPANVMPVVTTDADRYADNPSFYEGFESYAAGTLSNVNIPTLSGKSVSVWNVSGSPAIVQAQGGKALALSGTSSLTNVTFPENITAGDTYAEEQVWEISFTLQSAMSGSESVKLLTCDGDAGIKLQDNKVYYNNSTQLGAETLSAGTKYTVRREMDFANKKCSYYLLSGSTVLAKAENISISASKAAKIGISAQNLSGQKVLIDDYKLYPMGLTTDVEVYNGVTGMKLKSNSSNANQVAYRLSWLNGTSAAQKVKVMAEFDGGSAQVVKEIVMAPGCDGIDTGIVANPSGNMVKIYLSAVEATTIAAPSNYDYGDFSWSAQGAVTSPGTGPATPPVTEPPVNTEPGESTTPTDPADNPSGSGDPTDPDTSADPTAPSGSVDSGAPDTTVTPTDPDTTEGEMTPGKSKGLSGGVIVLIVVGAVVLAAAAGIGIWILVAKESALAAIKKLFGK